MIPKDSRVYIAGGWFSPEQEEALKELEDFVKGYFYQSFAPRVDNNGAGECDWDAIYEKNISHLRTCDLVIASTVGKDMGTIWECGYSVALKTPVIYYTPGIDKVNLMLSKSGVVCKTLQDLQQYLEFGTIEANYEIE